MSGWRERLDRGAARAPTIRGVVRSVRTGLRATHALESALLFAAGALLTRSAALLSSRAPLGPEAWVLAALCGALCAWTWWREHPVGLQDTARALDERLRQRGALLTAFELEERQQSPLEALLCRRVLARLRPSEAMRALSPPLLVPIAAPFVAGLALLFVLDGRREPEVERIDRVALVEGFERALAAGLLEAESAADGGREELAVALVPEATRAPAALAARGLPRTEEGWDADPLQARLRLESLDRQVVELASSATTAEVRAHLEEARAWLDALRMGFSPDGGGRASAAGDGTDAPRATGAGTDGTISRPQAARDPSPMALDPNSPSPGAAPSASDSGPAGPRALGVQAGSWWPAEYDALVERWIDLSRRARDEAAGSADGR